MKKVPRCSNIYHDFYRRALSDLASRKELKQVVLSALNEGFSHIARESTSAVGNLNKFFSPVDENVWRQIVK